jgi:predicted oxidoreductase
MTHIRTPDLQPVALSPGGPVLSPIVAGAWRMAEWNMTLQQRLRWIEQCLDRGITSFDHADLYGSYTVEAHFGDALATQPRLRERMQLVTKCGIRLVSPERPMNTLKSYDTTNAHVTASVEASLKALRTDHIDLLLIHRPDMLMDPDALAETFRSLRDAGKVLHFGVSNHAPSQFALLHRRWPLVTNQIELSPLRVSALADGTLDQCLDLGLRPMIWSPLAGGRLFNTADAQVSRVRAVLEALGQQHGASLCTAAYAWILRHPSRPIPITGSQRIEGLQEAIAALPIRLSTEDWYRVLEASTGQPVP